MIELSERKKKTFPITKAHAKLFFSLPDIVVTCFLSMYTAMSVMTP